MYRGFVYIGKSSSRAPMLGRGSIASFNSGVQVALLYNMNKASKSESKTPDSDLKPQVP